MNLDFEKYLQSTGLSTESIKNYKSDISQFVLWAKDKLKSFGTYIEDLADLSPFLSSDLVSQYLSHMSQSNLPKKTVNRRLSTLRHLSRFLTSMAIIEEDFMSGIQNVTAARILRSTSLGSHPSVNDFQAYLEAEKVSKNTIKNYMSDVRQFLSWLENNHAQSA